MRLTRMIPSLGALLVVIVLVTAVVVPNAEALPPRESCYATFQDCMTRVRSDYDTCVEGCETWVCEAACWTVYTYFRATCFAEYHACIIRG